MCIRDSLYYVLEEPIPMYPHNQKCLKELKYALTRQIWNRYTSTIKEPQMPVSYTHLDVYKRQPLRTTPQRTSCKLLTN